MANKYDISEDDDSKKTNTKTSEDVERFIDNLDKIKDLDEKNPLEQAMKFNAIKQNPPEPGYMEVRMFKDKDEKDRPVFVSESDHIDDDGKKVLKQLRHDPSFVIDLNSALMANVAACPSNVIPMLIDEAQRLAVDKMKTFKPEKRRSEFSWWWIVLAVLLIPGILTVVFMILGGGG